MRVFITVLIALFLNTVSFGSLTTAQVAGCADALSVFETRGASAALATLGEDEITCANKAILRDALEIYASADIARFNEDTETALMLFREAEVLFRDADYTIGALRSMNTRNGYLYAQGDEAGARALSTRVLEQAREIGSPLMEAEAMLSLAGLDVFTGDLASASTRIDEATPLVTELDIPSLTASLRTTESAYLIAQGDFASAITLFAEATVLYEAADDFANAASGYTLQGNLYEALGQPDDAINVYNRASEIYLMLDYAQLPHVRTLLSIAGIYVNNEDYAAAIPPLLTAVDVSQQYNVEDFYFPALRGLAFAYVEENAFVDALEWATTLREAALLAGDLQYEYEALTYEIIALAGLGRSAEIAPLLARIDQLAPQVDDDSVNSETLSVLETFQDFIVTTPDTSAGWEARLEAAGDSPDLQITVLLGEASWHAEAQRFDAALDRVSAAREIARANDLTISEAQTVQVLARLYTSAGRLPEALDAVQEAQAIAGDTAFPTFAMSLYALEGDIYYNIGQYQLSADALQNGLEIAESLNNPEYQAFFLNALGAVYIDIDPSAVNEYLTRANQLNADSDLGAVPNLAEQLSITDGLLDALTALEAADFDTAADLFDEVASEIATSQGVLGQYIAAVGLAGFAEVEGDLQTAAEQYASALDILLRQSPALAISNEILLADEIIAGFTPGRGLARVLLRQGDVLGAWNAIEQERVFTNTSTLLTADFDFGSIDDAELLRTEAALRAAVDAAQQALDAARSGGDTAAIQSASADLDTAQQDYQQHLERMRATESYRAREFSYSVATLHEVRAVLPEDTTLIVYVVEDFRAANTIANIPPNYALLLTRDRLQAVPLNAPRIDETESIVRAFSANRRDTTVLRELYGLVFAPLDAQINTQNVIIVPDRSLRYVPFAALQRPDGSYLIDDYAIAYAPTASSLVQLNQRALTATPTAGSLVVSQMSAPNLPDLPFANVEAERVAETLQTTAIRDVTETEFRQLAPESSTIVISAHAELDPLNPLFSTIHLGTGDGNDGRLQVREIYQLDLASGTELVVLSGCETGTGRGDDFGVLNRSFLNAGANQVVASLWTVNDEATSILMQRFMALRAEDGNTSAQALRLAMIETREQFPDPFFWAGFSLTGLPEIVETMALEETTLEVIPGGDVLVVEGIQAVQSGDYAEAIDLYTQAISLGWATAETFNRRGVASFEMGETEQALADFDQALTMQPTFAQAYVNRGAAYYNLSEYARAIEDFTTAFSLGDDNAETYNRRGNAYYDISDFDAAIADYTQARQRDDTVFWYSYNLGLSYLQIGQYDDAIADFSQAIIIDDSIEPLAYRYRADAYIAIDDFAAADQDYSQYVALVPDTYVPYQLRGMTRFLAGEMDSAQTDLETAIFQAPDLAINYYWAGLVYLGSGEFDVAVTYIEQAQTLAGDEARFAAYSNLWLGIIARVNGDSSMTDYFSQATTANVAASDGADVSTRFEALLALVTGDDNRASELYSEVMQHNPYRHQAFSTGFYLAVLSQILPDDEQITRQYELWWTR